MEQETSGRAELYPKTIWRENIESLAIAIMSAVFIMVYLLQACMVEGRSMEPTLHNTERLFMDKVSYQLFAPKAGDIVIIRPPDDTRKYIKRIIGVPGNRVKIADNKVYINEKPLSEPYILEPTFTDNGFLSQTIPNGKYLVLGDNRNNSRDGRAFGLIERKAIVGKAVFIFWPLYRIKILFAPKY